jgi:hypothetical protein
MGAAPLHKPLQYLGKYESSEPIQDTWIVSYFDVQLYYGEYLVPRFQEPVSIDEGTYSVEIAFDVAGNAQPGNIYTCEMGPILIYVRDKIFLDKPYYPDLASKIADIRDQLSRRLKISAKPDVFTRFEVTVTIVAPDGGSATNTIGKDDTIEVLV